MHKKTGCLLHLQQFLMVEIIYVTQVVLFVREIACYVLAPTNLSEMLRGPRAIAATAGIS